MIADRFFAAIDAVTDPATGQPVCRSDLDPTAYPRTTPSTSSLSGRSALLFFTFTPGDGQCQPMNIWVGGAMSQVSLDFVTRDVISESIEQTVFQAIVSGDSSRFFSLPPAPSALPWAWNIG